MRSKTLQDLSGQNLIVGGMTVEAPTPISSVPIIDLSKPEEELVDLIRAAGLDHGFFYGMLTEQCIAVTNPWEGSGLLDVAYLVWWILSAFQIFNHWRLYKFNRIRVSENLPLQIFDSLSLVCSKFWPPMQLQAMEFQKMLLQITCWHPKVSSSSLLKKS